MSQRRNETGTSSLEVVIVAPLLLVFIMLIIGLGRLTLASQDVTASAHEAARAASLTRSGGAATSAGQDAARDALGERGMACASVDVSVDVSGFEPGGQVRATVTCTARLSDLTLSGLPGRKTYRAEAVVPIEQYRAE